jgi:hypothetical protein
MYQSTSTASWEHELWGKNSLYPCVQFSPMPWKCRGIGDTAPHIITSASEAIVTFTPGPIYILKPPVSIGEEARWVPEPVWARWRSGKSVTFTLKMKITRHLPKCSQTSTRLHCTTFQMAILILQESSCSCGGRGEPVVQPIASHFTDCPIPAPDYSLNLLVTFGNEYSYWRENVFKIVPVQDPTKRCDKIMSPFFRYNLCIANHVSFLF